MPPPSKLSIATSSLQRLLKEEKSYHKELEQQHARVKNLEQGGGSNDENAEYVLRQERKAIEETQAIFPSLRQRIMATSAQLDQLLSSEDQGFTEAEVTKAQGALQEAKSLS